MPDRARSAGDTLAALRQFLRDPQRGAALRFILRKAGSSTPFQRLSLVQRHYCISARLISPHTTEEMLTFMGAILALDAGCAGCVVEAGSYKGSSAAKFSLAARIAGRELVICDSFQGLPPSLEDHGMSIENRPVFFHEGEFAGSLEEVKANIARYGAAEVCRYVVGWYDETLAGWCEPIAAIYMDVDLAASTRAVLRHLYPWLSEEGALYSQDGHLPLVLQVFEDAGFWREIAAAPPPRVEGAWKKKLIKVVKPAGPRGGVRA
ncbi:MAG TPA: TylF/MycF/NovP-related O-methyltransferase [Allosphingosinicella sp.]|jgi:O-methyltransferase|nr:TylF/MycF/NovP-related O-methyltransferase [Allosphingosinicella sp.]